jgi:2,5-dioxopentanoate dehydrogenase
MPETYHNYIDGEWIESETGNTITLRNPANTGNVIGEFQQSNRADAQRAVEAADAATEKWATMPGPDRGEILRAAAGHLEDRKDELTETLTREEGKTLDEARPEVQRAINIFYYHAEKARDRGGTRKQASSPDARLSTVEEPLGVAGLITPWNYPIAIPSWKMAPALATGNTVVFKPAAPAPNIARKLVTCLDDAGLPDGVVNYVTGPGSEVGDEIMRHDEVDAVSFTGSAQVGDMVYDAATDGQKRVQTEMGSKNPAVVTDNADLKRAVELVGNGAFGVTGQACTATARAIVYESIYDEFVERIVEYAESLDVGPGFEDYDMGPHASEEELEGSLDYIEAGQDEGATLETGGNRLKDGQHENGYFIEPTVFSDVESEMRIAQEEIFGPVLGVIPVSGFQEAVDVANGTEFGLSAGIVTQDLTEANRYIDEIDYGVVKINETTTGLELHVPFGGMNASSSETYREQGDSGLDFFTITKTVYLNY